MEKQNDKKVNWTPLVILGAIGASLVGMWKSTKIGKVIFIVLMCLIVFGIGSWGIGKFTDVYFMKIRLRTKTDELLKPIEKQIEFLKSDVEDSKIRFGAIDDKLKEKLTRKIDSESETILWELNKKAENIKTKLDEALKYAEMIKEEERKEVKKRIIYLKEDVIINEKSIDSSEIRLKCEEIVESLVLLTKEERDRFYKDLKDIGFEVEQQQEESRNIRTTSYRYATGDVATWSTVSCDSVSIGYTPNRRYYD